LVKPQISVVFFLFGWLFVYLFVCLFALLLVVGIAVVVVDFDDVVVDFVVVLSVLLILFPQTPSVVRFSRPYED
jgi:hypothetical protein